MKKTVNQWLDLIHSLPEERRKQKEVLTFKQRLLDIKQDNEYNGYGGTVSVEINKEIENILVRQIH